MNRKRTNFFMTFQSGDSNPRFSVIFPSMIWIFMEGEGDEIKSKQDSKTGLYVPWIHIDYCYEGKKLN